MSPALSFSITCQNSFLCHNDTGHSLLGMRSINGGLVLGFLEFLAGVLAHLSQSLNAPIICSLGMTLASLRMV